MRQIKRQMSRNVCNYFSVEESQVTSLGSKSKNQEIEWKLIAKIEDERDRTADFNGVAELRVVVDPTQLLVFQFPKGTLQSNL